MPWNASISRPTGRIHTSIPAISVEKPSHRVANRVAGVLRRIQRDATRTAVSATTPYTTAVRITAVLRGPKASELWLSGRAYRTRQHRLKPAVNDAPNIDA